MRSYTAVSYTHLCVYQHVVMTRRKELRIIFAALFPNQLGDKILLAKYFSAAEAQVVDFVIVDTNENDSVLCEKIPRDLQSRVNHVQQMCIRDRSHSEPSLHVLWCRSQRRSP